MASNGFQRVKAMGFTGNSTVTSAQGLRFLAEDICAVGLQASLASLDAAVAAGSVPSKLLNETPGPGGPGGGGAGVGWSWCPLVMLYIYNYICICLFIVNDCLLIYKPINYYIYIHICPP